MATSARGRARGRAPRAGPEVKRLACNDCLLVCDVQRDARPTRPARGCTGVDLAQRDSFLLIAFAPAPSATRWPPPHHLPAARQPRQQPLLHPLPQPRITFKGLW